MKLVFKIKMTLINLKKCFDRNTLDKVVATNEQVSVKCDENDVAKQ